MITDPLTQSGGGLPGWRFQSSLRLPPDDLKKRPVLAEVERGFAAHAARAGQGNPPRSSNFARSFRSSALS